MPPHSQAPTGLEIDYATHTIRFVRSFDAPADLVFEAWTTPEHLSCWWDAAGGRSRMTEYFRAERRLPAGFDLGCGKVGHGIGSAFARVTQAWMTAGARYGARHE